ncbi:TPA: hypothetical protein NJ448_004598 [Vibrio parahaemolyticus]|uniref:hypothetical protein n=2 Tax=Vibrio parahaemolyticus TaxID=670 RepID=UPI001122F78D|nr:hypothetical protein [Vibrio parahaemolyticus]EIV8646438.1 hypothetical protein [Vibrio parahaemolyticus]EIV8675458.1 hypothetical protein [Vibrio parahaemolyticus]ELA6986347.1 hypothetical protein [Vibrio parahaemolyticus]MBE4057737.1 hypothetical protein [Vibrio parahaemolyticus]MBE4267508.1 hypothetical protein [Vibrio parahaemolyticus]
MDVEVRKISGHMYGLGKYLLAHGIEHVIFTGMRNPFWSSMGVLHVAQAAEILIKSAIAQEHPLLIFTDLPKLSQNTEERLTTSQLMAKAKTVQYSKLPDLLWAATGYEIKHLDVYREMGEQRNRIQHLAVPDDDFNDLVFRFCIQVIDPLMVHFFREHFLDNLDFDDLYIYEDNLLSDSIDATGLKYKGKLP